MELNFDNIRITSYSELLNYITEEDIYYHFYGDFALDKKLPCPFRKETDPSFVISYYDEKLKWRRFGMYDMPMDALDLIMIKFNLNYYDALNLAYQEIYKGNNMLNPEQRNKLGVGLKEPPKGMIKLRAWEDYDREYWGQYHFTTDYLESWQVFPAELYASTYYADGAKVVRHRSSETDPLYCYKHGEKGFTAYRPKANSKFKFRKFEIKDHIMGMDKLPFLGEVLFITSSLKDVMTLGLIGIPAIAPHSERAHIEEHVIESLKITFKHIYVAYDNDVTGVNNSLELTKKFDLKYWNVPKTELNCKDPSDVSKKKGLEYLKKNIYDKFRRDGILFSDNR